MTATTKPGLRLTMSRDALRAGLAAVTPAIPSKPSLPILANVLFTNTHDGIRLTATDIDTTLTTRVAADIHETGELTIPAKRLVAIAKELGPSPCRIHNGDKNAAVRLECGQASYRLESLPEAEFPAPPDVDWKGALRIAAGDIQALTAQTSFCTSREESRPILNGVLWQMDGDCMRFVATNGHRLALAERAVVAGAPFADIIVPPKALGHIVRLFDAEDELEIARSAGHLHVRSATAGVTTRLIEGPYPDYKNVIPKQTDQTRDIHVDRMALLAAARRLVPVSSDSTHRLIVELEKNAIELRADTPDIGNGKDRIPCRFEGEPLVFGANVNYLVQILEALESDEVRILGSTEHQAWVIKPPQQPRNDRLLYLLMPLRILD